MLDVTVVWPDPIWWNLSLQEADISLDNCGCCHAHHTACSAVSAGAIYGHTLQAREAGKLGAEQPGCGNIVDGQQSPSGCTAAENESARELLTAHTLDDGFLSEMRKVKQHSAVMKRCKRAEQPWTITSFSVAGTGSVPKAKLHLSSHMQLSSWEGNGGVCRDYLS